MQKSTGLADRAIAVRELNPHTKQEIKDELGVLFCRGMLDHCDQVVAEVAYKGLYDGLLEREVHG